MERRLEWRLCEPGVDSPRMNEVGILCGVCDGLR